eukprot:6425196-Pyramimonas_sp.AAC.1
MTLLLYPRTTVVHYFCYNTTLLQHYYYYNSTAVFEGFCNSKISKYCATPTAATAVLPFILYQAVLRYYGIGAFLLQHCSAPAAGNRR